MGQVAAALRVNCWSISPLAALITTALLEDKGTAERVIESQKAELRNRQAIVSEMLGRCDVQTAISTSTLTPGRGISRSLWRGAGFARACLQRGVGVLPGDACAIGREPVQHGVRINIGAARSQADLRRALKILCELLEAGHLHDSRVLSSRWSLPRTLKLSSSGQASSAWRRRCDWQPRGGKFVPIRTPTSRVRGASYGNAGTLADYAARSCRKSGSSEKPAAAFVQP